MIKNNDENEWVILKSDNTNNNIPNKINERNHVKENIDNSNIVEDGNHQRFMAMNG